MPHHWGQHVPQIIIKSLSRHFTLSSMFPACLNFPAWLMAGLPWLLMSGQLFGADLSADGIPYDHGMPAVTSSLNHTMGERIYNDKGCGECHGPRGFSKEPDLFPRIAGREHWYIVEQLTAFGSGKRSNVIMSPIAETLTPDEIAALATYISGRP